MVFKPAVIVYSLKNGFGSTNEMGNSKKKPLTPFEQTLAQLEIRHKNPSFHAQTQRQGGEKSQAIPIQQFPHAATQPEVS